MSYNYNSILQSNNTDLQDILDIINELPETGVVEQATPVISVNSTNGLITATTGNKSSTYQLAFQAAKTITPTVTSQTAVSAGYYTGGAVTVAGDANLKAENIKNGVSIFGVTGTVESGGSTTVDDVSKAIIEGTITNITDDNIKKINDYAFAKCSKLTAVRFPTCTDIGSYAFNNCYSLITAYFPECTRINRYAFANCPNLTLVYFFKCRLI